jgi:hypothetical protein
MEMLEEAEELHGSCPNLFLVWPVADLESFNILVSLTSEGLDLDDGCFGTPNSDPLRYTAFPFHPALAPDHQFCSPFPMLHIIPNKTLSPLSV